MGYHVVDCVEDLKEHVESQGRERKRLGVDPNPTSRKPYRRIRDRDEGREEEGLGIVGVGEKRHGEAPSVPSKKDIEEPLSRNMWSCEADSDSAASLK